MAAVEHFDLSGKRAVVLGADNPAGEVIAEAFTEAGARVAMVAVADATTDISKAIDSVGGCDILASAPDHFLAKPFAETSPDDLAGVMHANFSIQFDACQAAVARMREQGTGGNLILMTSVLGERGLPNTVAYSAAQGAVFNMIRALAQEVAADGISVNGIELGWMDWMSDRINPTDESALRSVRFTMTKRAGTAEDIGPLAVWLAGSGVGFVTGQIFPLDGGLTQHL